MATSGSIDLTVPLISNPVAYTPTLDSGITNTVINTAYWYRVGESVFINGLLTFNGNGGAAEEFTISLPSGIIINTAVLAGGTATSNQGATMLGFGYWFIQGSGWKFVYPNFNTTGSVFFVENTQHIQAAEFNNGDGFRYEIIVPILG